MSGVHALAASHSCSYVGATRRPRTVSWTCVARVATPGLGHAPPDKERQGRRTPLISLPRSRRAGSSNRIAVVTRGADIAHIRPAGAVAAFVATAGSQTACSGTANEWTRLSPRLADLSPRTRPPPTGA